MHTTQKADSHTFKFPIDPKVEHLICKTCWATVFSDESFDIIWRSGLTASTGLMYQTQSWADMQESIEHMCEWCDLVCENILAHYQHRKRTNKPPPNHATFSVTVSMERRTADSPLCLRLCIENDWKPRWDVYADDDDPAAQYISARDVVWETNTPSTFDLALQCINDCSGHTCCAPPKPSQLPTRVIDCRDPDHPRLVISDPSDKLLYVALSYVWGEKQPHSTTTANFKNYTAAINLLLIPKTIRDAITVTRKLGLRYLWVDAFCIIQDSDDDKAHQIPMIRAIFRNAYITIIAAAPKKPTKVAIAPNTLPFRCPDGSVGTMLLGEGNKLPDEPVDTRAWCLEERVLSPRKLIYCTHALQFECQSVRVNVNGSPSSLPSAWNIPRLPDYVLAPQKVERMSESGIQDSWRVILRLYTQRALTKSKDRLIAFSAIAEQFQELWPQSRYIVGLWEHQLPQALLWQGGSRPYPRPLAYRGPSWSWAAMDGEVSTNFAEAAGCLCHIVKWQVDLKNPNHSYGEAKGGFLELSTIIRQVTWDPDKSELFEEGSNRHEDSENGEIGYTVRDAVEQVSEIFAAVIKDTGPAIHGLVLAPVINDSCDLDIYRRVGFTTAPFCNREAWLSTAPRTIRIV
ncbi:heterokaryon incompatibility protein-domain-containing protein [Mycena sanguinolenta]|nr:heterokaryon incompatibility protein-domain-containing protein [Mycena sanguinolenta]